MKRIIAISLMTALVFCACKTNRLTNISMTGAYDSKANFTEFTQIVYHVSDSVTRIYYRLNTSGLLYAKNISDKTYKSHYRIYYELVNSTDPKNIMDSLSFTFTDSVNYQSRNPITDSIDMRIPFPGKYILSFSITDLNRKNFSTTYINISKDTHSGRQNFLLLNAGNEIMFTPCVLPEERMVIVSQNKQQPRLFVRYYKREYPIALPPFVETKEKSFSFKPDSVFFIEMTDGISLPFSLAGRGIYHFQEDTLSREGYTIFRFHDDFPKITLSEQMLYPLRYISSKTEFNDMMMMKNTKDAVDNFWLDKSGNPDRAKEMIRRYYNRVLEANKFFTSYQEGWKTDRGMIYIVYGPPNLVYKNPDSETWIYGEDRNVMSMTFIFSKVENPFTDNDYSLSRSQEYKNTWYTAVDGWRN